MATAFEFLHLDLLEDVAFITLDRPPLNVLTIAMNRELETALRSVSGEPHLKAIVLRAEGRAFCAGVDVADHTPERVDEMIRGFGRLFTLFHAAPVPTIAAVRGAALGGGTELALGCDIVLAGVSARFGQPEIKLGVFPPIAAAFYSQRIGYQQAARLVFTGEAVSAPEALRMGLITEVAPDADLSAHLDSMLTQLRAMSAAALRMAKRALLLGETRETTRALDEIESLYLTDLMATADAREGIQSFMEKRQPVWRDA
ncbi:MAG TPA: enoyl-CoA hydratase-related protein [Ktedonobacterales bacterium]